MSYDDIVPENHISLIATHHNINTYQPLIFYKFSHALYKYLKIQQLRLIFIKSVVLTSTESHILSLSSWCVLQEPSTISDTYISSQIWGPSLEVLLQAEYLLQNCASTRTYLCLHDLQCLMLSPVTKYKFSVLVYWQYNFLSIILYQSCVKV